MLSIPIASLRAVRLGEKQIAVVRLGRRVRYSVAALMAFANGTAGLAQ